MIFLLRPINRTSDNFEKIAIEYSNDLKARYGAKRYVDFQDMEHEDNPVEQFKGRIRGYTKEAYFIAYSHGSDQSLNLTTHGEIFGINDCGIFMNKSCYLVACHAMTRFGPELISCGAKAVLGYKGEFWSYINRYDPDNIEKLKNCLNDGIIIFLERRDKIKRIFKEIKKLFLNTIKKIEKKSSITEGEIWVLGLLSWNMSKLDYLPKN